MACNEVPPYNFEEDLQTYAASLPGPSSGYYKIGTPSRLGDGDQKPLYRGTLTRQTCSGKGVISVQSHEVLLDDTYCETNGPFKLPSFSDVPVDSEPASEQKLDDVIKKLRHGDNEYFIATSHLPELRRNVGLPKKPLRCGDRLLGTKTHYCGIQSEYVFISPGISIGAFHEEDFALGSANLVLAGYKYWVLIDPVSKNRFMQVAKKTYTRTFSRKLCDQFVRHMNVIMTPAYLRDNDIKFTIEIQRPGDLILLYPDVYHYVINPGRNVAVAINWAPETWDPSPISLPCTELCLGHRPMPRSDFEVNKKRPLEVDDCWEENPGVEAEKPAKKTVRSGKRAPPKVIASPTARSRLGKRESTRINPVTPPQSTSGSASDFEATGREESEQEEPEQEESVQVDSEQEEPEQQVLEREDSEQQELEQQGNASLEGRSYPESQEERSVTGLEDVVLVQPESAHGLSRSRSLDKNGPIDLISKSPERSPEGSSSPSKKRKLDFLAEVRGRSSAWATFCDKHEETFASREHEEKVFRIIVGLIDLFACEEVLNASPAIVKSNFSAENDLSTGYKIFQRSGSNIALERLSQYCYQMQLACVFSRLEEELSKAISTARRKRRGTLIDREGTSKGKTQALDELIRLCGLNPKKEKNRRNIGDLKRVGQQCIDIAMLSQKMLGVTEFLLMIPMTDQHKLTPQNCIKVLTQQGMFRLFVEGLETCRSEFQAAKKDYTLSRIEATVNRFEQHQFKTIKLQAAALSTMVLKEKFGGHQTVIEV